MNIAIVLTIVLIIHVLFKEEENGRVVEVLLLLFRIVLIGLNWVVLYKVKDQSKCVYSCFLFLFCFNRYDPI